MLSVQFAQSVCVISLWWWRVIKSGQQSVLSYLGDIFINFSVFGLYYSAQLPTQQLSSERESEPILVREISARLP